MTGVLRRPADVAIVEESGVVYLGLLPGGPLIVLDGSASVVWHAAQGAARDGVARRVAEATGVDERVVAPSVAGFVDELLAKGLLESS